MHAQGNSLLKKFLGNKFAAETFWSFSAKGAAFILYFSLNIYLARALGVNGFGAWSYFYAIFTIILVLSYSGINNSAQKYIAQYSGTGSMRGVLVSSFKLRLAVSFIFAVLVAAAHRHMAFLIKRPEFSGLFLLSAPLIFFSGILELLKKLFMGLHRLKYGFIVTVLEFGLKLAFSILILKLAAGMFGIIISFAGATAFACAAGLYLLYSRFYKKAQPGPGDALLKEIFNYSLPLFVISIGFLIATEIDTFMLGLLSSDSQVGIYAAAKNIISKLPQISLAVAMGTMPVFAKLNKENKNALRTIFIFLLKVNTGIFVPIIAGILLFADKFTLLVYGNDFAGSAAILRILTLYVACFSFSIYFSSLLDYQGLARKRAVALSFSTALNIALNFVLIPRYGAAGAAIATTVSYLPYLALNGLEARRVLAG